MTSPDPEHDARLAELLEEFLALPDRDGAAREALLARHPAYDRALREALAGFDFIRDTGGSLPDAGLPELGTLGDFRLVREVGRGGMGVVYEAEQVSLGRRVALKVLPFAAVLDGRQLQRFRHESQAAALLHHTNIVPVYSVGCERGVHYYAMQFVDGRTLAEVLAELRARRGPASQGEGGGATPISREALALTPDGRVDTVRYCREVARIGAEAAEALDHAHENGVVHRDVKPGNLMVDARGHVWVTDFGLARSRSNPSLTATGAVVGTLRYMSPEQARPGARLVDHRSDVYSLGVTLIEAVTLEPPFADDDPRTVLADIEHREPAPLARSNPRAPPALDTILRKAVAKDPELRYATARELAEDLRRFLNDRPVLARRPPLTDRALLWARRHRGAVRAAGAAFGVSFAALAVSAVRIDAERRRAEEALADARRSERSAGASLAAARASAEHADRNFRRARRAVDRLLVHVGDEDLSGVPGLEPVRRALLEDAAAFYGEFLADAADDPDVRLETARAHQRLGELRLRLGDLVRAEESLVAAAALLASPTDGPAAPLEARADLADVQSLRGEVRDAQSRLVEALPFHEAAAEIAERNLAEREDDPRLREASAKTARALAAALRRLGRWDRATAVLRAAIERQRKLAPLASSGAGASVGAARLHQEFAYLVQESGSGDVEDAARRALEAAAPGEHAQEDSDAFDAWVSQTSFLGQVRLGSDEAVTLLRRAFDAGARRAERFPHFPRFASGAAGDAALLEVALRRRGLADEAARFHDEALRRWEAYLARFGDVPELVDRVASALVGFAELAGEARPADADAALRRAVALRRDQVAAQPENVFLRAQLADALHVSYLVLSSDQRRRAGAIEPLRESVALLDDVVRACPDVPAFRRTQGSTLNTLAIALEQAGDPREGQACYDRGIAALRDLVALAPNRRDRGTLAALLANSAVPAQMEEAVALSRRLAEEDPQDPEAALRLGSVLSLTARLRPEAKDATVSEPLWREATSVLEAAAALRPQHRALRAQLSAAHFGLADLLREAKRLDEAERSYQRAVETGESAAIEDPGDFETRRKLGNACVRLAILLRDSARADEAAVLFRKASTFRDEIAEAHPGPLSCRDAVSARDLLAACLFVAGRRDEAGAVFSENAAKARRWAERDPVGLRAPLERAVWKLALYFNDVERHDDARPLFAECVRLRGEMAEAARDLPSREALLEARLHQGIHFDRSGRLEDAETEFRAAAAQCAAWTAEDAAKYAPLEVRALQHHTVALARLRRVNDEIAVHARVAELVPSNLRAWSRTIELLVDPRDTALRDTARAVEVARRSAAGLTKPGAADALLAIALTAHGDHAEAVRAADRARAAGYHEPGVIVYEALARARLGETDAARKLYEHVSPAIDAMPPDVISLRRRRDEVAGILGLPTTPR